MIVIIIIIIIVITSTIVAVVMCSSQVLRRPHQHCTGPLLESCWGGVDCGPADCQKNRRDNPMGGSTQPQQRFVRSSLRRGNLVVPQCCTSESATPPLWCSVLAAERTRHMRANIVEILFRGPTRREVSFAEAVPATALSGLAHVCCGPTCGRAKARDGAEESSHFLCPRLGGTDLSFFIGPLSYGSGPPTHIPRLIPFVRVTSSFRC